MRDGGYWVFTRIVAARGWILRDPLGGRGDSGLDRAGSPWGSGTFEAGPHSDFPKKCGRERRGILGFYEDRGGTGLDPAGSPWGSWRLGVGSYGIAVGFWHN